MPQNLTPAQPTAVMPAHLCRAFHEDMHLECDLNLYPDGSTDRMALAHYERHYWTMQATLSPTDYTDLRTFYMTWQGKPFYFYNPRETAPPFSWDASGGDPVGRYIVAFEGAWSETYGFDRAEMIPQPPPNPPLFKGYAATVSLGLREVG
jgi:hypothetical protein